MPTDRRILFDRRSRVTLVTLMVQVAGVPAYRSEPAYVWLLAFCNVDRPRQRWPDDLLRFELQPLTPRLIAGLDELQRVYRASLDLLIDATTIPADLGLRSVNVDVANPSLLRLTKVRRLEQMILRPGQSELS